MTVEDNLEMGAYTQPNSTIEAGIADVYERFPRLKERRKQIAGTLSGGEQQMLAMGRALMSKPKLLMLDRPSMVSLRSSLSRSLTSSASCTLRARRSCSSSRTRRPRSPSPTARTCLKRAASRFPAPVRSLWRATPSARPTSAVKSPANAKSHPKGWLFLCSFAAVQNFRPTCCTFAKDMVY